MIFEAVCYENQMILQYVVVIRNTLVESIPGTVEKPRTCINGL